MQPLFIDRFGRVMFIELRTPSLLAGCIRRSCSAVMLNKVLWRSWSVYLHTVFTCARVHVRVHICMYECDRRCVRVCIYHPSKVHENSTVTCVIIVKDQVKMSSGGVLEASWKRLGSFLGARWEAFWEAF